jgi:hypothetical protein
MIYTIFELILPTAVPLLPNEKHIFKPSKREVVQAQKMYVQSPNNNIQFLKSALFEDQLPDYDLPEVIHVFHFK